MLLPFALEGSTNRRTTLVARLSLVMHARRTFTLVMVEVLGLTTVRVVFTTAAIYMVLICVPRARIRMDLWATIAWVLA